MEFVAKLDDQISGPSANAASAQTELATATKATDATLRALDATQAKAAIKASNLAKSFNTDSYKKQVLAERELTAAKEKALQQLGLGLSQKEKDEKSSADAAAKAARAQTEEAAKAAKAQAEAERKIKERTASEVEKHVIEAERKKEKEVEKARKKSEQQRAAVGGLAQAAKGVALGFAAAAGASSAMSLAKIAVGYQGMARLQAISFQASMNFRRLFTGVDSRPLERAYLSFTRLFSMSTVTGRAISDMGTRGFNALFKAIEKAEPYFSAFVQGSVMAILDLEYAWLRVENALLPYTYAIGKALGDMDGIGVAATAGGLAITALAGYAAVAAAPFLTFAAAITAVVTAADQLSKAVKEWDTDVMLRSLGLGGGESDADKMNRQYDAEEAARRAKKAPAGLAVASRADGAAAVGNPAALAAAGMKDGLAAGAGLKAGLAASEPGVRGASANLGKATSDGYRGYMDINSPSRLMRKNARYAGEGAALGYKDTETLVQRAATETLVPSPRGAAAGGAAAGGAGAGLVLNMGGVTITVGAGMRREEVQESFDESMMQLVQQVEIMMGGARASQG